MPFVSNTHVWSRESKLTLEFFLGKGELSRYYDPKFSRFLSVDPLASDMPAWGSYTYTFNNPVRLVDPTGMGPEVLDWEPRVEYGGNITYVSEDGDSYETFVEQSGEEAAQKTIEANFGDLPISLTGVLLPQEGGSNTYIEEGITHPLYC